MYACVYTQQFVSQYSSAQLDPNVNHYHSKRKLSIMMEPQLRFNVKKFGRERYLRCTS